MAEFRELLETQIVALVIKNGTEQELDELEQVHLKMKQALKKHPATMQRN